jgi:hypothetical protein
MATNLHICVTCDKQYENYLAAQMHQVRTGHGGVCTVPNPNSKEKKQVHDTSHALVDAEEERWAIALNSEMQLENCNSDSDEDDLQIECAEEPGETDDQLEDLTSMQSVFKNVTSMRLAYFINETALSKAESKRLISIITAAGVHIDFNTSDALKKRLDKSSVALDLPRFTCVDLKDNGDGSKDAKYFKGPMLLAYRDIVDLVKCKFRQRRSAAEFTMRATQGSFYSELHSGDWWRRTERKVKEDHGEDVHILGVYLYTDETNVTSFGNTQAYPLHVSIGNFRRSARKSKENGNILLAYLPVCKPYEASKKAMYVSQRGNEIRQRALQMVLEPLMQACAEPQDIMCPDGAIRRQ